LRPTYTPPTPIAELSGQALQRELERLRILASRDRGLLDAILEHSPHGIIICDAAGRFVVQNRASERIWAGSSSATKVSDWNVYRAFHEDGTPFRPEDWAMAECMRTKRPVAAREYRIQRFDDSFGYLLGSSAPIIGREGELEGAMSVFADITQLKESEQQNQRLQSELGRRVQELEQIAARAALLQRVTAAIGNASTAEDIARVVTTFGSEVFGADASLCLVRHDDKLRLMASVGVHDDELASYREVDIQASVPMARVARENKVLWLSSPAEIAAEAPMSPALLGGHGLEAKLILPLQDEGVVFGVLAYWFRHAPALLSVRREFAETVALQCAQGLKRARLFERERRARRSLQAQQRRLSILAQASKALSTLDSREALAQLARSVVPELTDWCAIDEKTPDGQIRRLILEHRDPAKLAFAAELDRRYPPSIEDPHGVANVLRTGEREWAPDISDELLVTMTKDAEHLRLARALDLRSYAVVPLLAHGRVFGALTLVTEGERRLSKEDLEFAEELGSRAALALENARLYETAEAARNHLHDIFMRAPAAIAIVRGCDLQVELANQPYEQLMGQGPLTGRPILEREQLRVHPVVAPLLELAVTRTPKIIRELCVPGSNGSDRYFHVIYQPLRSPSDQDDGVTTFAFDITEQVVARQRIERLMAEVASREARLKALVAATAAIVWTANARGEVIETSDTWLEFTGQSEAEYQNGGFLNAIHPDDRAKTMELWTAAVGAAAPYGAEYRLRRRDGTHAYMLARGMPVFGADGTVQEYVGCNVDITGLRQAEEAARGHAEALQTLNDLGMVISAELDRDKCVQAVTDAVTTLTGASFGAFFYNVLDEQGGSYMLYTLSGVPREAFSKFPMPRNTAVFAPTFTGQGVVRVDDITKDPRYGHNSPHYGMPKGHLPVRSYLAAPVTSRSGEVIGGLFLGHDRASVFDARAETLAVGLAAQAAVALDNARLFAEAQRLIRALESTNRDLDQFAYVTSHDLKAPLRGISSLAAWIEEDLGVTLAEGTREKLQLLRGRVKRLEALIQGILDYSRAGRTDGKREMLTLDKVVAESVELVSPPTAAEVAVGEMPIVVVERVALQQVFMNLIGNALKHARREDARINVSATELGSMIECRVSDNGPGIAPAYHERIWGIFQTLEARDRVENTGIGLSIVKKIVEGRGGRVWVESTEGQGATFCFTWPRVEDRRVV